MKLDMFRFRFCKLVYFWTCDVKKKPDYEGILTIFSSNFGQTISCLIEKNKRVNNIYLARLL